MESTKYKLTIGTPCLSSDKNVLNRGKIIGRELGRLETITCLDAGCGYGAYIGLLADRCSRVFGVDANESYLQEAKSQSKNFENVSFAQMSLESMALCRRSFDFIICIETLEHVKNDHAAIGEFRRLLKPNGRIVLSVPYKWFPFETHGIRLGGKVTSSPFGLGFPLLTFLPANIRKYFATARVYSRRDLVYLFNENGFRVEEISFLMPGLDIFERKSRSKFLVKLFRNIMYLFQKAFECKWGSTIVLIASPKERTEI